MNQLTAMYGDIKEKILNYIYQDWDLIAKATLVDRILLFILAMIVSWKVIHYLVKYRVFSTIFLRMIGNMQAYDRAKRAQIREQLENMKYEIKKETTKVSFLTKLYSTISRSGITSILPGLSESSLITAIVVIDIALSAIMWRYRGIFFGIIFGIVFLVIFWYTISLVAYNRVIKLERQLMEFANACASSSVVHTNLIDIFGSVYDQFESPLKDALEECYIEAKQTNNKDQALEHLKRTFDSTQFSFVIDNLAMSAKISEDYTEAAKNVCDVVAIYNSSREKKDALVRKARIDITLISLGAMAAVFIISLFFSEAKELIFNTAMGNTFLLGAFLVYFYGLNIKAEKR